MVFKCNIFPLYQELKGSLVLCVEKITGFDRVEKRGRARGKWRSNHLQELIPGRECLNGRRHRSACGMRSKQTKQNWQRLAPGARREEGAAQGSGPEDEESENPVGRRWLMRLIEEVG